MDILINYDKHNVKLVLKVTTKQFYTDVSNKEVVRYLKGTFTNKKRFESRFINLFRKVYEEYPEFECGDVLDEMLDAYDDAKPFTYSEAFKLKNQEFQALVFGSINITEMIENLGYKRIATEGIKVKHKQFKPNGDFDGYKEYDNVYEVHEVSGKKLGIEENLYVLKCWCTSTDKEHWLWIEDDYKNKPLEAVASTFRIHENLIPHIKEIKRQGDVLLVEMKKDVKPDGDIVPLTADQYFSLLTCQS